MDPFATVAQYDARFPGRTASDEVLGQCLMDATMAIAEVLDRKGVSYADHDEQFAYRLMSVCRSVANRILPSDVPVGTTQFSMTAGPYTQTTSYTPTYGLPKLLKSELDMLGVGGGSIGFARPAYGRLEPEVDSDDQG